MPAAGATVVPLTLEAAFLFAASVTTHASRQIVTANSHTNVVKTGGFHSPHAQRVLDRSVCWTKLKSFCSLLSLTKSHDCASRSAAMHMS